MTSPRAAAPAPATAPATRRRPSPARVSSRVPGRVPGRGSALLAALVAALLLAYLAGCSTPAPTPAGPDPAQRLAALKAKLDRTTSVRMELTSRDIPGDARGLLSARGVGAHPAAFKGTVTVRLGGSATADIDLVAVGGKVYAKLPFLPGMRQVDPAQLNGPDPSLLLDADKGITKLLVGTGSPAQGERRRVGSDVVDTITGTLPGQRIVDVFWTGDPMRDFSVIYGYLPDSDELRLVELTGPFYAGGTSSYVLTLDEYDRPVDIGPP